MSKPVTVSYDYKPVCPFGYKDCIEDPAYLEHNFPIIYEESYESKTPDVVVQHICPKPENKSDKCPYYNNVPKYLDQSF